MDRTKANEYARRYREANRELLREKQRVYYWKNRKKCLGYRHKYYKKNKERINKDPRQLKRHRDWIKKNPEKNRMYAHRRRLREKGNMIKFCKECGKEFEAGKFNPKQIFCCRRCKGRNWRRNNREKIRERGKIYYRKNREKCRERERIYYRNHYRKNREKCRERERIYREKNREKIREQHRDWREKNKEKVRERGRIYREKNREKERERCRRYREKNRDKNREKIREQHRDWREKNKEKVRERNRVKRHRRRAWKKGNGGSFTAQQIRELRKQSQGICKGYKREPHFVGEEALTIDHIIPLYRGGTNNIDNIQLLCLSCNCKKGRW